MAYIPDIELGSIEVQEAFQLQRLQALLIYLQTHSPFYQRKKIDTISIQSIHDLYLLTTTCKEDIQLLNQDFYCVSQSEIAEYTATSGTLGSPVTIPLTQNDIHRLAYNEYLSFELLQLTHHDTVQLMLTLDKQFMAGMAYYLGLQKNGASSIRTGPGLPAMQFDVMERLSTTALVAVPSFLSKMIEYAQSQKLDISNLAVQKALCIGENIRNEKFELNALGQNICQGWNLKLFSTYASTEMQTAFTECEFGRGGHAHPELIILEIVDEQGNQLKPGEYGEVCITTLGVEAMPLLRYRTGDICCYYQDICACGRNTKRLSPVIGRKKQMIKYKGTTIYPPAIFDLLNEFNFVDDYLVEVDSDQLDMDEIILHLSTSLDLDECDKLIKPFLQSRLRVIPKINYLSSHEIQAMQFASGGRKPLKFIDNRKNKIDHE